MSACACACACCQELESDELKQKKKEALQKRQEEVDQDWADENRAKQLRSLGIEEKAGQFKVGLRVRIIRCALPVHHESGMLYCSARSARATRPITLRSRHAVPTNR